MRTFRKLKEFGTTASGATGGKSNEGVLFVNGAVSGTLTVQSLAPTGSIIYVGPISFGANQTLIYPIFTYGWTASQAMKAYELF
jgi:hypothetical protein